MNGDMGETSGEAAPLPLARRPDFTLGMAAIRPSIRTVEGPAATRIAEPRVMQVLLALADARGAVLTRSDLLERCWTGQLVGDDAVNRAIAEARRVARETGAGFTIETIPRIGYRLAIDPAQAITSETTGGPPSPPPPRVSRRTLLITTGGAAAAGGAGIWAFLRSRRQSELTDLLARGRDALQHGTPESWADGIALLREAVALAPDDATAWGWLAAGQLKGLEDSGLTDLTAPARDGEQAARRALALDPSEANGRATLALLRAHLDPWTVTEARAKEILASAPDNLASLTYLLSFYQAVGRCEESRALNEHVATLTPLSPTCQHRRALKHWIFGKNDEADRVIDRARLLWPQHPLVWNSRLLIYAFTGRAKAARAMIEDVDARPSAMRPQAIAVWDALLPALENPTPAGVARARTVSLEAAPKAPYLAANTIMTLSALGEIDAAFTIAEGFLLGRGHMIGRPVMGGGGNQMLFGDPGWRKTQWLFTPATAPLRADRRFRQLAQDIGMADYWRARGIGPDSFVRGAI